MKIQKSKIDWKEAINDVSPNAYHLLSVLYYLDVDGMDAEILSNVQYGKSTYDKAKRELVNKGYLKVVQVRRHTYKYIVGDDKIKEDDDKYLYKELLGNMIEGFKILNLREPDDLELSKIKREASDVYLAMKESKALDEIKLDCKDV